MPYAADSGNNRCRHASRQCFDSAKTAMNKESDRQDAQWGKPVRPMPDPDDHWLVRLSLVDDEIDAKPLRAKPQTIKRLALKKG